MKKAIAYIFLTVISLAMLYPLLWLFGASFKSNAEIYGSIWFMPQKFDLEVYKNAWKTNTGYSMGHYFLNTFAVAVPKTVLAVVSSLLVAYGFARFEFPFKKFFYTMLAGSMLMPETVKTMPMYIMWSRLNLTDTYIPLVLPSAFATEAMFVFVLVQFIRGVPKEFDDSARIDGCSAMGVLFRIIVPCIKPAVITTAVFSFLWTLNDFINPLVIISQPEKYTLSLALRVSVDSTGQGYEECKIIAMSVIGLIPSVIVFAFAQNKLVSGISTGGLSGQ